VQIFCRAYRGIYICIACFFSSKKLFSARLLKILMSSWYFIINAFFLSLCKGTKIMVFKKQYIRYARHNDKNSPVFIIQMVVLISRVWLRFWQNKNKFISYWWWSSISYYCPQWRSMIICFFLFLQSMGSSVIYNIPLWHILSSSFFLYICIVIQSWSQSNSVRSIKSYVVSSTNMLMLVNIFYLDIIDLW